jgi:hypothetical protein
MRFLILLALLSCSKNDEKHSTKNVKDGKEKVSQYNPYSEKWIVHRITLKETKEFIENIKKKSNYPESVQGSKEGLVKVLCKLYENEKNIVTDVSSALPGLKYSKVEIESDTPKILNEILKYFLVLSDDKNNIDNLFKVLTFQGIYDFDCEGINLEEFYMNKKNFYSSFFNLNLINNKIKGKSLLTHFRQNCRKKSMKTTAGQKLCSKAIFILQEVLGARDF